MSAALDQSDSRVLLLAGHPEGVCEQDGQSADVKQLVKLIQHILQQRRQAISWNKIRRANCALTGSRPIAGKRQIQFKSGSGWPLCRQYPCLCA